MVRPVGLGRCGAKTNHPDRQRLRWPTATGRLPRPQRHADDPQEIESQGARRGLPRSVPAAERNRAALRKNEALLPSRDPLRQIEIDVERHSELSIRLHSHMGNRQQDITGLGYRLDWLTMFPKPFDECGVAQTDFVRKGIRNAF